MTPKHKWIYIYKELEIIPRRMRTKRSNTPQTPTPIRHNMSTPSHQLAKHAPLGAYPTPQSSTSIPSPGEISPPISTSTERSSKDVQHEPSTNHDEIKNYLEAQDQLRMLYPLEDKVPSARICVVGGQSSGKSSALSALTRIDLYCHIRRATCCRTLISSRRGGLAFSAAVHIIVLHSDTGKIHITPFAESIEKQEEMSEICHWAGEEARRADGGINMIRPWSVLRDMPLEDRTIGKNDWPEFTKNVAAINVSGPGRPNFDIKDLPGLNGHPTPEMLVAESISQTQNLIVLCLTADLRDATSADPEIKLAKKYDPTGERTIGIITKADGIIPLMDENGSTCMDYILGIGQHFGDFVPQGHWWPLRLRSTEERQKNISLQQVRHKEIELFMQEEWTKVQKKVGRKFGIEGLEKKLEQLFADRVRETMITLRKTLREFMGNHHKWLAANPTIEDPVAALHDDIIYQFADSLKDRMYRSNQSGKLVDLQTELEKDITKAVPEFLPFMEDEGDQDSHYQSFWKTQGFHVDTAEKIPVDILLQKIKEFTSRRNPDDIDSKGVMQLFQEDYVKRWHEIALNHVKLLWDEVDDSLLQVAGKICKDNIALRDDILEQLENLTTKNKAETTEFVKQMTTLYSSPPSDLISPSKFRLAKLKEESYKHFLSYLNAPLAIIPSASASTSSASSSATSSPTSTIPRLLHDTIISEDRIKCASLQANIGIAMMSWALEYSCVVGKYAQLRVLEYSTKVIPALRKGMGLDEVVEVVKKRAGDKFENDKKKKRERERIMGEVKKLSEIQLHLEKIVDV
ncbi:uncharacterized protein L201_003525 [Kwoniella dendrophila CBS 6074]|uniref:Dynamin GTPase domain-containing protein n=1 Tax=Kwoniella dendrophila CBS 6074 TaxID=1295534 RepID=A0AAX4JT75_9TREE